MRYASGDVYVGPWKRDLREGKGTFQYAGGARYEGEYKCGVMDGRGTYRFADGSVYVGEYKAGKREGRGVYRFSDVRPPCPTRTLTTRQPARLYTTAWAMRIS